ncbi:MAG: hypothetical protein J0L92_40200 [Deltaproteobacteria bacterium]|nr:hypothetical protein [Deltaproteobacteria bacterium]
MSAETDEIRVNLSGPNSGGGSYLAVRDGRVHFVAYGDEALGTSPVSYTYAQALEAYARHGAIVELREAISRAGGHLTA